jgi:hypothetical protein
MNLAYKDIILVVKIIIGLLVFSVIAYVGWKLEKSHIAELHKKSNQDSLSPEIEPDLDN